MRITVRQLTPADQPHWRDLRLEALAEFPHVFRTTAEEQRRRAAADDRAQLAQGRWRGLFRSDRLIGIAALVPNSYHASAHRFELSGFYVAAELWGTEAAQNFIDILIADVRRKGGLQIEINVASDNARAIRFYERNGFEKFGTRPRAILSEDVVLDEFFYVCMLDR